MDINQLYKAIIEAIGLVADDEGRLSVPSKEGTRPAVTKSGRLALPTLERLRSGNWEGLVAFHPLSEHVLRGESEVLQKLRGGVIIDQAGKLSKLLMQLVELGADSARHAKMSPTASELLSCIKDVDTKSVAAMEKLIEATANIGPTALIKIFLKRGATLNGTKYSRAAIVSFPILDEFANNVSTRTVYGVDLRRKDFEAFQALFEYILPEANHAETYSAGSRSSDAPYFDALMRAFHNLAHRLNQVVRIQRKQLEDPDSITTDLSWFDAFSDLSVYRDLIPPLPGNTGEGGPEDVQEKSSIQMKAAPAIQPQATHKAAVPAEPAKLGRKIEDAPVKDIFNTNFKVEDIVPGPTHVQQAGSLFHTATNHNADGSVTDSNNVRHTARGVDFASLMEVRARNLAAAQGGFAQPGQPLAPMGPVQPVQPAAPVGAYAGYYRGVQVQPQQQFAWGGQPAAWGGQPAFAGGGFGGYNPALPEWAQDAPPQQPPMTYGYQRQPPQQQWHGQHYGNGVHPPINVPSGGFRF